MPVVQTGYMSVADFRLRTVMPQGDVDLLEIQEPDFLQTMLNEQSAYLDARLRKRYQVPFTVAPIPVIVFAWLTALVTPLAYAKRGWNPTAEQDRASILDAVDTAKEEIKEAANSVDGLFDLPLVIAGMASSAITSGGPLGSSSASPYQWTDRQYSRGSFEDSNND